MTRQLVRISVRSVFPIAAAVFFVLGAVVALVSALGAWIAPGPVATVLLDGPVSLEFHGVPPAYVFVLYPFLSAAAGSVVSAALAWLYNLLARRVGALHVTWSD